MLSIRNQWEGKLGASLDHYQVGSVDYYFFLYNTFLPSGTMEAHYSHLHVTGCLFMHVHNQRHLHRLSSSLAPFFALSISVNYLTSWRANTLRRGFIHSDPSYQPNNWISLIDFKPLPMSNSKSCPECTQMIHSVLSQDESQLSNCFPKPL